MADFRKGNPDIPDFQKTRNICKLIEQYKEFASRSDQAQIGFAIASPQLLLQGGNRLIVWHVDKLSELLRLPVSPEKKIPIILRSGSPARKDG